MITIHLFEIPRKLTIMKKSVIILSTVLLAFSSAAIVYLNQGKSDLSNEQEVLSEREELPSTYVHVITPNTLKNKFASEDQGFYLAIDSRFIATISKEKLQRATSIYNLVPEESTKGIVSFEDVKISKLVKEDMRTESGKNGKLNPDQLQLLQSFDYSNNFCVEAMMNRKNENTGEMEKILFVYYITVVPETETSYEEGQTALISYFKKRTEALTIGKESNEFQAGKVRFTVTKDGKIDAIELESTSGNSAIDQTMLDSLKDLPGNWTPATNTKGEKVDQQLVLSFGSMGC